MVIPYFDDVLVPKASEQELAEYHQEILLLFHTGGLQVKEKGQFGMSQVGFLGFPINSSGIHLRPSKVKAIRNMPPARTKLELQSFWVF